MTAAIIISGIIGFVLGYGLATWHSGDLPDKPKVIKPRRFKTDWKVEDEFNKVI